MGVDMHGESKLVFWTDVGQNSSYVFSAHFDNKDVKPVITSGLIQPEDIAVDYVGNNIYLTDAGLKQIIVCKIDGSSCAPIVKRNIDNIRAIALDVQQGKMYWTDWGKRPGIFEAQMDGSHARPLVNRDIIWPNGLTYDRYKKRIYWSDAKLKRIEYYDLITNKRFVLIDDAVYHPHCLTMFEDSLYWADWDMFRISKSNKLTGHNTTTVFRRPNKVYGMHIYHPVHYPSSVNPCCDASCSHLCLIRSSNEFKCACPNNMHLDPKDRTTCLDNEDLNYLLVGLDNGVKQIWPQNIGKDITRKLIDKLPKDLDEINEYTYAHRHSTLFLHASFKPGILKVNINSQEQTAIFNKNLSSIYALTYDDFSDNLYWLDLENSELVVGSIDGRKKITLISSLKSPSSIALNQEANEMFIGLMGDHPQILIADLDGKNSKTLIDNIGLPTSLAVCKLKNQLYWADSKKGTIESISLNDTTSKTIVLSNLGHVNSLVIKDQMLYWTNVDTAYLYMMNLDDQSKKIMLASIGANSSRKKKLIMVDRNKKQQQNDCLTQNKCSDICLFKGFKLINNVRIPLSQCVCSPNAHLTEDKRTCGTKKHCKDGEFTCHVSKKCIRMSEVCDGHKNCENNEDEEGCPEVQPCKDFQSRCNTTDLKSPCILNSWFCDDQLDCPDGLDEKHCHQLENSKKNSKNNSIFADIAHKSTVNNKCEFGYFNCDTNICIPWDFVCDGELNCADKTDEGANCLMQCSCKNNGKCYLDSNNVWACQCPPDYEGRNCETRKDFESIKNEKLPRVNS